MINRRTAACLLGLLIAGTSTANAQGFGFAYGYGYSHPGYRTAAPAFRAAPAYYHTAPATGYLGAPYGNLGATAYHPGYGAVPGYGAGYVVPVVGIQKTTIRTIRVYKVRRPAPVVIPPCGCN